MLILVNQDKQGQSSYEEHYYNFQINLPVITLLSETCLCLFHESLLTCTS